MHRVFTTKIIGRHAYLSKIGYGTHIPYNDAFIVRPTTDALASLKGIFSNNGINASIDDMNSAIADDFPEPFGPTTINKSDFL